jgi:hypothetical protein
MRSISRHIIPRRRVQLYREKRPRLLSTAHITTLLVFTLSCANGSLSAVPSSVDGKARAFVQALRSGDAAQVRQEMHPRSAASPKLNEIVRATRELMAPWDSNAVLTSYESHRGPGQSTTHRVVYRFGPAAVGQIELWLEDHGGRLLVETFNAQNAR